MHILLPTSPVNICTGTVPIRLESIKGQKSGNGVALNWKVTCLSTNIVMEIERAADTKNFKSITSVTATQARCAQPFDFTASLSVYSAKAGSIETVITDMSGRIVESNKQSIPTGASLIKVDCSALARGIYNISGVATGASIRFIKL